MTSDVFMRGVWDVAARKPDHVAITEETGRTTSFGELISQARRCARGLRALGLGQGDNVAVLLDNRAELLVVYLAAMEAGFYFTPINFNLTESEVAYILDDCDAGALVTSSRFAAVAHAAADSAKLDVGRRFSLDNLDRFRPFDELLRSHSSQPLEDPYPGDVMVYTSGTTGRPKGVRRALGNGDVLATFELFAGLVLGPDHERGTHLVCGPLYFRGPFIPAATALHCGHTLVLMQRWDAARALQLIEQHHVTTTYMVPTMFHRLLQLPGEARGHADVSSLRYVLHSAAPCPVDEKRAMLEWFGPKIHETYGGTEGGGTRVTPEEWLQKPGTVGRAWPGAEIVIVDDEGNPCPPNVAGTVYIRPTSPSFDYHNDAAKTAASKRAEMHTLGDIGYLDDDGYLFLQGRRSDLILSGGVNVYPAEVEAALLSHPGVADVAVFGIPDDEWGEKVLAIVVPGIGHRAAPALADELLSHCRERLARYKCPRVIEFRDELPRTDAGKLAKYRLQADYWPA